VEPPARNAPRGAPLRERLRPPPARQARGRRRRDLHGPSPRRQGRDGEQERDFVYVGDVVAAILAAGAGEPGTYNVGTGIATSVNELWRLCAQAAGSDGEPEYGDARQGELRRSVLDASRAERELGWRAATSLDEGLRATWESPA
jgi:UDP-glucose 4-epimerase